MGPDLQDVRLAADVRGAPDDCVWIAVVPQTERAGYFSLPERSHAHGRSGSNPSLCCRRSRSSSCASLRRIIAIPSPMPVQKPAIPPRATGFERSRSSCEAAMTPTAGANQSSARAVLAEVGMRALRTKRATANTVAAMNARSAGIAPVATPPARRPAEAMPRKAYSNPVTRRVRPKNSVRVRPRSGVFERVGRFRSSATCVYAGQHTVRRFWLAAKKLGGQSEDRELPLEITLEAFMPQGTGRAIPGSE